jgi:hypothetical protein
MKNRQPYWLARSALIEPLVNSWSAWSFLIAPVPASLHLLQYQLELLQSYVDDPEFHASAGQYPTLAGSAFVNIASDRVSEVKALLDKTLTIQRCNLEFARSILDFQRSLLNRANGLGLAPYYQDLPQPLRGYVELVYDYCHRPSIRFFENLVYESRYYNPSLQTLRLSVLDHDGSRQFFLNTPRLFEKDQFDWGVSFNSPQVDELFRLDTHPQPLEAIGEILGVNDLSQEPFLPMFTERPRVILQKWKEDSVRVRYFGHACLLIERKEVSILTDPLVSVIPTAGGLDRFSYSDLPEEIDYALVTHNHQDHNSLETLLRLRHRIRCLVVPKSMGLLYGDISLKALTRKIGFKNVLELDAMESSQIPGGEILAVPFLGEHADLAHSKTGYVIRLGKRQLFVGSDADCIDRRVYENVRGCIGCVDTVFLGTESVGAPLSWINKALLPQRPSLVQEESRRQHGCDARRALDLIEALGATRVYNYAMGMEPWMEHIVGLGITENSPQWQESEMLLALARSRGFSGAERFYGKAEVILEDLPISNASFVPTLAGQKTDGEA